MLGVKLKVARPVSKVAVSVLLAMLGGAASNDVPDPLPAFAVAAWASDGATLRAGRLVG
jgi:hypothetical protein